MKSDASPCPPDIYVSIRVPSALTQHKHHVFNEKDIEEVVENQEPEGQGQDSIATHKPKRTI